MNNTLSSMNQAFSKIRFLDIHSHVDTEHATARGLDDILLYHMVVTELYSAGCPFPERMSEWPTEAERRDRLITAIPYLKFIRNTALYGVIRHILRDLYGWEEEITLQNWERIDAIIRDKHSDVFAVEVFEKAGLRALNTEYWRKKDGRFSGRFFYCMEWGFFSRCQYKVNDIALLELENTLGMTEPGEPIPVTMKPDEIRNRGALKTVEDVDRALDAYCAAIPFDEVRSIATSVSTAVDFRFVTREEMIASMANRENATERDRDVYMNYITDELFKRIRERKYKGAVTFGFAAEPLEYETGVYLRSETLFQLVEYFRKYPELNFQVYSAGDAFDQNIASVIRETPNLSIAGYWWHCFFPSFIERQLRQRLEMLPNNKFIGFFSDAYCLDWTYGKQKLVRGIAAKVFAEKVDEGYYTFDEAVSIAESVFVDSGMKYYNMA